MIQDIVMAHVERVFVQRELVEGETYDLEDF
jgi:hypothetical protein